MIVLVTLKTGEVKKAFMRNNVFHDIDTFNKKSGTSINTAKIDFVKWPKGDKMTNWPVKDWIAAANETDNWGMGN